MNYTRYTNEHGARAHYLALNPFGYCLAFGTGATFIPGIIALIWHARNVMRFNVGSWFVAFQVPRGWRASHV